MHQIGQLIFWKLRWWVDASVSFSTSIHSSSYSLTTLLLKLPRSLRMLNIVCSRCLILCSISRSSDPISALFFSVNNSNFAKNSIRNDFGSLSLKKFGLIQVIVSVGYNSSLGTRIDSNAKMATFRKQKLCFGILNLDFIQFFK